MKDKPTTIRLSFCIYGDYFEVDRVTDINRTFAYSNRL